MYPCGAQNRSVPIRKPLGGPPPGAKALQRAEDRRWRGFRRWAGRGNPPDDRGRWGRNATRTVRFHGCRGGAGGFAGFHGCRFIWPLPDGLGLRKNRRFAANGFRRGVLRTGIGVWSGESGRTAGRGRGEGGWNGRERGGRIGGVWGDGYPVSRGRFRIFPKPNATERKARAGGNGDSKSPRQVSPGLQPSLVPGERGAMLFHEAGKLRPLPRALHGESTAGRRAPMERKIPAGHSRGTAPCPVPAFPSLPAGTGRREVPRGAFVQKKAGRAGKPATKTTKI